MAESKEESELESELEREERVIAAVTPRRSPRLAQKLNFCEGNISTPLKEPLRIKIGTVSILDETKQFVAIGVGTRGPRGP